MELERGMDFRLPEYRREVFIRFFLWTCRRRSHPGAVYYLMPWLRQHYGWTAERALWFAFLNGNTQHPVTSLLLMDRCDDPTDDATVERMLHFYRRQYPWLAFDTDRRHWKKSLPQAVDSYRAALKPYGGSQADMWQAAASGGFAGVWDQATALYGFGRLSAFSYAEYLKIMGVPFTCDDLMLGDKDGSRSHRNGLCIATGQDGLVWDRALGTYDGRYPPKTIVTLTRVAASILEEAQDRAGAAWRADVNNFTLESALCTYKGWHKPNRRYPGVYNDMLYTRLKRYEETWPGGGQQWTAPFWQARHDSLPAWMRLEDSPYDPGCVPVKQNWYRTTGEIPVMGHDDPVFWSGFDSGVGRGEFGLRKDLQRDRMVLR
jgi:hypothetical protein